MDFTREPIIETIITPRDGCKLVVRSSKSASQEEYFVDAVEVVAFGHALFFRSLERPKAFIVPVNDYEVLEVREARMVLKNIAPDRSIKIGGGREAAVKVPREEKQEAVPTPVVEEPVLAANEQEVSASTAESVASQETRSEARLDKKRDRRRHYRKRRGNREEVVKEDEAADASIPPLEDEKVDIQAPNPSEANPPAPLSSSLLSSLLQPPPTLISETINRYRENALFKNAFFLAEDDQYKPHDKAQELLNEEDEDLAPTLKDPAYEPLEEVTSHMEEKEESVVHQEEPKSEQPQDLFMEQSLDKEQLVHPSDEESLLPEVTENVEDLKLETVEQKIEKKEEQISLPLYAEEEKTVTNQEVLEEDQAIVSENSTETEQKKQIHYQEDLPF